VISPSNSIPFVKATACGNDFLLIHLQEIEREIPPASMAEFTRKICDRHNGVGADGVEWISPHPTADVEIRLINADGSDAEISGNGTRCVAASICESQHKDRISIMTGAGLKTCVLVGRNEFEYEFEAEMGDAVVEAEISIASTDGEVYGVPVSMGNPHFVVFMPRFTGDWRTRASAIQRSAVFTHGVNVEMVVCDGLHDIQVKFFERGVGETLSSGTGSCAAAVAAVSSGRTQFPVRVHADGGIQTVTRDGTIFLRGPARLLCHGNFFLG
jgi:diaminopimelate epimerase